MAFWTYILRCADGRYYTGHTDDLERRIGQHQQGGWCVFTSTRRPVTLVWSEYFSSRLEALEAERIVGGWSRGKKEALIRGDWTMVSYLARPPRERGCGPAGFSTSLETNGGEVIETKQDRVPNPTSPKPFASSEVEKPVRP